MTPTATPQAPELQPLPAHGSETNPWVRDHVLFGVSVWWVRMTNPHSADFASEVSIIFKSLQEDLQ
jgi:hypothetical protein